MSDRRERVLQPYNTFLDLWKEFDKVFALYRENVAKDRSAESGPRALIGITRRCSRRAARKVFGSTARDSRADRG